MSEDEFYNSTLRTLSLRIKGHFDQEEQRERNEYERMRVLAYHVVAPYMKDRKTIEKFMPFDWDRKPELPTDEDLRLVKQKLGVKLDKKGRKIA